MLTNIVNIYLDINGVLIDQWGKAPAYADEFVQTIVKHWPDNIFWLSSLVRGDEHGAVKALNGVLSHRTLPLLANIKTGKWEDLKTDAINFKEPFLWYDDNLMEEEREILEHYDALDCHHQINLIRDPGQLLDEIIFLKSLAKHH